MNLFFGSDDRVAQWISYQIDGHPNLAGSRTIGLFDGDLLIAACAYNRHVGFDCSMTMAAVSPRWATRGAIRAFMAYPFRQLGCRRVTASAASDNPRSIRMLEGFGFVREGVQRKGYDGVRDAVCFGMLIEDCRWLGHAAGSPFQPSGDPLERSAMFGAMIEARSQRWLM